MSERLFVGLRVPLDLAGELVGHDPGIRRVAWQRPEGLHLTLAFLGQVDGLVRAPLEEALGAIRVPPFMLPVAGVDTFGGDRPSVVWAGVGGGHPHLFALHKHVHDAALAASIDLDPRPFRPHVTLARCRGVSRETLKPFLRKYAGREFGVVPVRSFALFSSRPDPGGAGPDYRVEREWGLG